MPSKMKTQAAAIAIAREIKMTLRLVFNIPSVWATDKTPEKKRLPQRQARRAPRPLYLNAYRNVGWDDYRYTSQGVTAALGAAGSVWSHVLQDLHAVLRRHSPEILRFGRHKVQLYGLTRRTSVHHRRSSSKF